MGLSACSGLLDVTDPTLVQDKDIANAAGANARRLYVLPLFWANMQRMAVDVAMFTDERRLVIKGTFSDDLYYLDRRDSEGYEAAHTSANYSEDPHLGQATSVITQSAVVIPNIRAYTPDSLKGDYLAQLFAFRGYAILQAAEDICPGFPITDIVDNIPVYSKPFTADSAARYAITQLDSVVATVKDSTQYLQFARVLRGRALLDVGRYAEAAAAVASVPTDFVVQTEGFSFMFINPYYWSHNNNREWTPMGEREGGNGLPFVSTNDPRIGPVFKVVRYNNPADSLYDAAKYTDNMAAMTLASGIEARLIEAEAALNAGDPSWFTTLNTLRATMIVPAMAPIASMPVTTDAKVDLLYQERAFWLYLTGRRLGDLRRLMRNYGRGAETLFPTGPYSMRGGNYSTATAIPFVQSSEQRYNPNLTSGCTTR